MMFTAIVPLLALLSMPTLGPTQQPDLTDYDVLLVPVFFFGPGAHGSQWETEVNLVTVEDEATMPVPMVGHHHWECAEPSGLITDRVVASICSGYASPSGLFLYVPKTLGGRLFANSVVRDVTRQASSAGTAIPIVRESEFRSTDLLLPKVPSDARFRANLRVYTGTWTYSSNKARSYISQLPRDVRIEIHPSDDLSTVLATTNLERSAPELIDGSPYYVRPGYASIPDLVAMFPQLASVPSYTIRIVNGQDLVTPITEQTSWGFVTITNNDTQEVTTVSP